MSDNHISTNSGRETEKQNKPTVIFSAGGKGTRIRSLNSAVPKPMIPIAGKPILQWGIENLAGQGYKDFIITVSHLADAVIDYFGDGSKFNCSITYYHEAEPLGNAGALFKMMQEGRLEGSFFYFIADAVFDIDADRFWNFHCGRNALATLFVHPNSHPYDSGLVISDGNGVVTGWLNKEDGRSGYYKNQVNAGLQILSTRLLEASGIDPVTVDSGHRVDLDRDVLKPLIPTRRIFAYKSSEYCKDAGTPERFCTVEEDIRSGRVKAKSLHNLQKAIFLDRDGTINRYVGFLRDIGQFELLPGVTEAIKRINDSGYLCIVVTNQPVVARGEVTEAGLRLIHNKMETLLGRDGAYVDAIYYCPHHPDKGFEGEVPELKFDCECRKPKPGMLLQAARDYNIDLSRSWMVGDGWRDMESGKAAGCKTVLIVGNGSETMERMDYGQDKTAESLFEAVEMIGKREWY